MGILQRTKVLSNTKRKVRRRRQNLEKHWDMIATKAQLLGDRMVAAVANRGVIVLTDPPQPLTHTLVHAPGGIGAPAIQADTWMLQQMNIKPTSKSRERLRDALMRLRKQ